MKDVLTNYTLLEVFSNKHHGPFALIIHCAVRKVQSKQKSKLQQL